MWQQSDSFSFALFPDSKSSIVHPPNLRIPLEPSLPLARPCEALFRLENWFPCSDLLSCMSRYWRCDASRLLVIRGGIFLTLLVVYRMAPNRAEGAFPPDVWR